MRRTWRLPALLLAAAVVEALLPGPACRQPVAGAGRGDWNPASFGYAPWGESGVHKGIDIFARRGTPVLAAQAGFVLYRGEIARGGRVVLMLTPRGWLHYYAHLDGLRAEAGHWLAAGDPVGTVGDSGNARGKPPHLHYAVLTLVPRPWELGPEPQGWKRMFYRDPGRLLP